MQQVRVHPTAIVHPTARLGEGVVIGPWVLIEEGVVIGDDTSVAARAVVKAGVSVGKGNRIHEGAILGGTPQDLKFKGDVSRLRIGDGNIIREGVTVHRSTHAGGETVVGNENFLMAYAHVAHDCRLEDGVILANNVCLAGHVRVESHAFLSGGVVVHQFCQVGRYSMVGGNAKVEKDVLPYFLADGVPARTRALNLVGLRRHGFTAEDIRLLKQAYRILLGAGKLEERLAELSALGSAHADYLVEFVRRSERGFCRAATAGHLE